MRMADRVEDIRRRGRAGHDDRVFRYRNMSIPWARCGLRSRLEGPSAKGLSPRFVLPDDREAPREGGVERARAERLVGHLDVDVPGVPYDRHELSAALGRERPRELVGGQLDSGTRAEVADAKDAVAELPDRELGPVDACERVRIDRDAVGDAGREARRGGLLRARDTES